jgi:hypothetical protein
MFALLFFFLRLLTSLFKSTNRLEAENAALRHQLIVLQRNIRGRLELTNGDRLFFILLYRWFPSILKAITIIRPETLVRWHRARFRRYWRWKSRNPGGALSLPEIKSGGIDGVNLRGAGWPRSGQRPEHRATPVHPCSAIGACEHRCNISGTIPAGREGAARRTPRHDQGSPVGSNR